MFCMHLNISNVLLLFGMLQCLVMVGLIFFTRKWQQVQNQLLLALLIILGISLMPPFFGNTTLVLQYAFLRFAPLYLGIFVFPTLYLYFKSVFVPNFQLNLPQQTHLWLPAFFWTYDLVVWLVTFFYPANTKDSVAKSMGYSQVQTLQYIGLLVMTIFYTHLIYTLIQKALKADLSKEQTRYAKWMKYLLGLLFLGALLELISVLLGKIYGYWQNSPLDEWLGFSFTMAIKVYNAIVVYAISLAGYTSYATFKAGKHPTSPDLVKQYLPLIKVAMEQKRLYLSSDFSLTSLAKACDTTPATISYILNNHLHVSFNDFTNKYRVEEVKQRLHTDQIKQLTLVAIAQEAGFTSKTTFYRAFRKFTSQTPKAYMDSLKAPK